MTCLIFQPHRSLKFGGKIELTLNPWKLEFYDEFFREFTQRIAFCTEMPFSQIYKIFFAHFLVYSKNFHMSQKCWMLFYFNNLCLYYLLLHFQRKNTKSLKARLRKIFLPSICIDKFLFIQNLFKCLKFSNVSFEECEFLLRSEALFRKRE